MEKGLIFTYGLTAVGAIGGIINPFYGLLVYVCFAIVRPEHMWPWSVEAGNYSRIVGVAMLVGWALRGFGRWEFGRATAIVYCLLAYWFWMMASALQAANQERAWDLVLFYAKVILPFMVGMTMIRSMREVKLLAWVILLSQGYLAFELNLAYYSGYNKVWYEGFGGMDNNCVAIAMVTGVGLAFFLGVGAKQWWVKGVALLCAALMAHVIMFSFSRGGVLALGLTGMMAFWLIPKGPKHYLAFLLAVALAIRMAGPEVQERFLTTFAQKETGEREASAQSRLLLWTDATDAMLRRPILGLGPDNWGDVAPEYGWNRGKEVHSLWVQNLAEVGIVGVALLVAFFGLCMLRLWPLTRQATPINDPWMRDGARMVIASLIGFVIAAQFVTIKYLEVPFYIALVGAGILRFYTPAPVAVRDAHSTPVRSPQSRVAWRRSALA